MTSPSSPEPPVLPAWCSLVRADNPGPMTLEGTNTYRLKSEAGAVVVDPGPLDERHLDAVAAGGPVQLILLTHGHPDHAEGAAAFADRTGAPLLARDAAFCTTGNEPLQEGDPRVRRFGLTVLATPGHTADSVSFVVELAGEHAVLTGDTVLGRGTTVVAHPDGRLRDYLSSLDRLAGLADGWLLLPGHGPVRADAGALARDYLAHRAMRLDQVRAAVAAGAATPQDVVRLVYADVDRALWPAAELSVRAQLDYLADAT